MMGAMVQEQALQQNQANNAPYMNAGKGALSMIDGLYGIDPTTGTQTPLTAAQVAANNQAFTQTPDYNFAYTQGLQAVDRSQAANGQINSGGAMKAAQEFGQGLASQQYGNYFNRLLSLSQLGQASASGNAAQTLASANSIASSFGNYGTAAASGAIGSANAVTGALGNAGLYAALGSSSYGGSGNSSGNGGFLTSAANFMNPNYSLTGL